MNNNKKYELFLEICDFYDYKVSEENEKIICRHDEENYFEYKDIDEALCDWYNTLMDSNENHEEYNEVNRYTVWSKEEIDFIRCLIRDKALDVVASYNIILDIPIKNIEIKNCFDVVVTSEKEGKTTVNKMDDYCRIFIDEINTLIDIEHDENKKTSLINMRNIMLDYKYMIKEYRAELVAIGKYVRDEVKDREFYDYVNWGEFNEDVYANIGYNMSKHKENMQQLIDYSLEKVDDYSDWTFDLIVKYVDNEVENEGYTFDCTIERFVKEIKDNNMGEVKDSENKIKKCEVNNMGALQVKYDIDLKYRGIDFIGVSECYKIECKGIPCVKDDKLELVNALYSQKGEENYIIKFIEINNVVYSISDMKYWYGINSDELFEQIDYLIREQETPKEYIKTSYGTYKIENFDDVLEADLEGCIEEFCIEDEVLSNVVQKYMGCDVEFLVSDLNTLLEDINNDMDALESVLGENPKLSYWLNSEVYCYPNCNLDEAYERYLEEEEEIPFKAIDYIDINAFIKNETDLRELELNNCTILYC